MDGFAPGQEVRLTKDVVNDGTMHGSERGQALVSCGSTGFIKQKGWFLDDPVYDVHFLDIDQLIGCREHELIAVETPWTAPAFSKGSKIKSKGDLTSEGQVIVPASQKGFIETMRYDRELGYLYEVNFEGAERYYLLLESQLEKS